MLTIVYFKSIAIGIHLALALQLLTTSILVFFDDFKKNWSIGLICFMLCLWLLEKVFLIPETSGPIMLFLLGPGKTVFLPAIFLCYFQSKGIKAKPFLYLFWPVTLLYVVYVGFIWYGPNLELELNRTLLIIYWFFLLVVFTWYSWYTKEELNRKNHMLSREYHSK